MIFNPDIPCMGCWDNHVRNEVLKTESRNKEISYIKYNKKKEG
jgi:hypothetical protein